VGERFDLGLKTCIAQLPQQDLEGLADDAILSKRFEPVLA